MVRSAAGRSHPAGPAAPFPRPGVARVAVFQNQGLLEKVKEYLAVQAVAALTVKLYVNDFTPDNTSLSGQFQECTLPGYATIGLTPANWTISATGGMATATYPTLTWNFTNNAGGVTVYGYYVIDTKTGTCHFSERFATPFAVPAAGGALTLQLNFYDQGL